MATSRPASRPSGAASTSCRGSDDACPPPRAPPRVPHRPGVVLPRLLRCLRQADRLRRRGGGGPRLRERRPARLGGRGPGVSGCALPRDRERDRHRAGVGLHRRLLVVRRGAPEGGAGLHRQHRV
ncbi:MAG: hypothetical protein ACK559_31660, partial [bacterium]